MMSSMPGDEPADVREVGDATACSVFPSPPSPPKSWTTNHSPSDTHAGVRTVKKKKPSGTSEMIVAVGHKMT